MFRYQAVSIVPCLRVDEKPNGNQIIGFRVRVHSQVRTRFEHQKWRAHLSNGVSK